MVKLGQYLNVPLGAKKANVLGAVLGVLVVTLAAAGVAFGALTVSNILTFGPFQVAPNLSDAVSLTETRGLPSSIASDEKYEFRFTIEAIKPVANATLWFELSADTALNDPSVLQVTYDPPSGSPTVVDLKSTGEGRIRGALKAGWDIFVGSSDGEAKIKINFLPQAPTGVSYFVEVWVDTPSAGASPTTDTNPGTTPTYVTVGDDFFSPGMINISAGSTVTWTWGGGSGVPHTTTGKGAEEWDSGVLTSGSYSRTFNAAGTFAYVCKVHSDMTGTIIVQ